MKATTKPRCEVRASDTVRSVPLPVRERMGRRQLVLPEFPENAIAGLCVCLRKGHCPKGRFPRPVLRALVTLQAVWPVTRGGTGHSIGGFVSLESIGGLSRLRGSSRQMCVPRDLLLVRVQAVSWCLVCICHADGCKQALPEV